MPNLSLRRRYSSFDRHPPPARRAPRHRADARPLVLTVEPAHVGRGPVRLEHDGDPVQLLVPRMKDVSGHDARSDRGAAVAVERRGEVGGDDLRRLALDLMAMDEVHDLAVSHQRDRRAARLILARNTGAPAPSPRDPARRTRSRPAAASPRARAPAGAPGAHCRLHSRTPSSRTPASCPAGRPARRPRRPRGQLAWRPCGSSLRASGRRGRDCTGMSGYSVKSYRVGSASVPRRLFRLAERRLMRVPRQAGALDADRKLRHPGEHGELAQCFRARRSSVPVTSRGNARTALPPRPGSCP